MKTPHDHDDALDKWRRRVAQTMHIATAISQGGRVWLVQRNGRLEPLPEGPRIVGDMENP